MRTLFQRARAKIENVAEDSRATLVIEHIATGAWDVTAEVYSDLEGPELLRRANQLRAYAARAATLSTDLAAEAGKLDALASTREADQSAVDVCDYNPPPSTDREPWDDTLPEPTSS